MTFLELCQEVRQECGIQGSGPAAVTSQTGMLNRVVTWTAKADMLIQSLHSDWNFLWKEFASDTAVGNANITRPANLGIWDRESYALNKGTSTGLNLEWQTYTNLRKDTTEQIDSKPSTVCILPNGNLRFDCPSDIVYQFTAEYWSAPVELTENTQEPVYPARFNRLIIVRAMMYFFADIEAINEFNIAKAEYDELLVTLESYALPNQQVLSQNNPSEIITRPV